MPTSHFDRCTVLITGGTGSFGKTILARLVQTDVGHIRVFSRDEAKQDTLREQYADDHRLEFFTGDIRDLESVTEAMEGCQYVFHAAALKQVPNCERFPLEAVRTNVMGAANVLQAAKQTRPLSVVAISTDKASLPLCSMGLTKALMERILLNCRSDSVRLVCVRYGNVVGSRGSVVPLFLERVKLGKPLPITDPGMTRFLLCLDQAVDLVFMASRHGRNGELWVRKMPASTVRDLAIACSSPDYPTINIGIRPGEKLHETLVSSDEMRRAVELDDHFIICPPKSSRLDGNRSNVIADYTSENTTRLTVEQIRTLLHRAGLL